MKMIKVYTAKSMTGRPAEELVIESATVKRILNARGIVVLDPVAAENVKKEHGILKNTGDKLKGYWKRDKQMIRDAHVILDITGPAKSEGTAHEIGYARYALWKPVVRIFPTDYPKISVAKYEDDVIVDNVDEAAEIIVAMWGTLPKRIFWRVSMLLRCLPKWLLFQIQEFK
jgi:nucleoside 2-deoxyribosyltransferase